MPTRPSSHDGFLTEPVDDSSTLLAVLVATTTLLPSGLVFVGVAVTPAIALGWLLALAWTAGHLRSGLGLATAPTPVRTAIFVFALVLLLVFAYTSWGPLTAAELKNSGRNALIWVSTFGAALVAADGLRSVEGIRRLLRVVSVTTAVVALLGVVEALTGTNPASLIRVPGLRANDFAGLVQAPRDGLIRAQSTTGHPIEFGVLCAMVAPVALYLALGSRTNRERLLYSTCVAALGAGAVFSVSRSAVLGLAVVGVVLFVGASPRSRLRGLAAAAIFVVALQLLAPRTLSTLSSFFLSAGDDPSVSARTDDYPVAILQFLAHPLLGRGVGTWFAPVHQIFDNQYLLSLVETGLLGVGALLALFLTTAVTAARVRAVSADDDVRSLALALAATTAVPVLTAATFDLLSYGTVTLVYAVLAGTVAALARIVGLPRLSTQVAAARREMSG